MPRHSTWSPTAVGLRPCPVTRRLEDTPLTEWSAGADGTAVVTIGNEAAVVVEAAMGAAITIRPVGLTPAMAEDMAGQVTTNTTRLLRELTVGRTEGIAEEEVVVEEDTEVMGMGRTRATSTAVLDLAVEGAVARFRDRPHPVRDDLPMSIMYNTAAIRWPFDPSDLPLSRLKEMFQTFPVSELCKCASPQPVSAVESVILSLPESPSGDYTFPRIQSTRPNRFARRC
ncbi:hypothetical protein EXIGLDRAFT_119656 [Exidia glandulosa HHB12029]|uniref:Uncharacterized protein n=1 Tax=Exidia glandulosa HHB12029 TaxID=1314781 RepID=A0A165GHD2_EXIGL|nr:hypothetical protein EXIGLDRAFT_119656 [Exidia glandulosa HHB12029]